MVAIAPSTTSKEAKVEVCVRIRPLITEEQGHAEMDYKVNESRSAIKVKVPSLEFLSSVNPALTPPPLKTRTEDQWKTFAGFTNILQQTNEGVYQSTLRPLVQQIARQPHQSACLFTYGHTGSGKSHTLLGYGKELGIYKHAAAELLHQLQSHSPEVGLLVRVTELYKDQVLDLIDQQQCNIRQDAKGIMQLRGPMVEDAEGRLSQQTLGKFASTPQQVMDCVEDACYSRRVGTSTHHSQSSRSHLVLELEVVTPQLLQERANLQSQQEQYNRLQWLQTERIARRTTQLPKWTQVYQTASRLRQDIRDCEGFVKESRKRVAQLSKTLGGTLVVCDLAGNEYAQDSRASSQQELEEAAEINKSLLAVKEVIRSLSLGNHVPYRASPLTRMLQRHLTNQAIMVCHISPSQESIRKTINTLKYGSMVVKTPNTTTTTSSSSSSKATISPRSKATNTSRKNAGVKPWATKRR